MVFPASAADDTLTVSEFSSTMCTSVVSDGVTYESYYTFSEGTENWRGVLMHWWHADDPNFYLRGNSKILTTFKKTDVQPSHNYDLDFYASLNYSGSFLIKIIVAGEEIYFEKFNGSGLHHVKSNFNMPSNVTNETYVTIVFEVSQGYTYGSNGEDVRYYISENIDFIDRTENPGWLQKILNKIGSIKDWFTSLGQTIGSFFSDLKDSVGNWFAEQAQKIQDFSNGVKQWFQDLGDRIQQFFVDLYNNIVEGLKSLFIPSDGYFESKKTELETFATEHFGALYQAPDVMVDMIRKFANMSPQQPSITLPAIQFDFQGTRYVLSESITYSFSWVNDSGHMLYYFYKFYRGFVAVILFVAFGNYCVKKYNEVFGGNTE